MMFSIEYQLLSHQEAFILLTSQSDGATTLLLEADERLERLPSEAQLQGK